MDIRYSANPNDVKRYTTEELRKEFLIENLYEPDQVKAAYSHVDRMVVLGITPVTKAVPIDQGIDVWANFGTNFFLERREAGVFNLGGPGAIVADGVKYDLKFQDCLYITMGTKEAVFSSDSSEDPARFYLVSAPAHRACKTTAGHQPVHPPRRAGDLPALHGPDSAVPRFRLEHHACPHP